MIGPRCSCHVGKIPSADMRCTIGQKRGSAAWLLESNSPPTRTGHGEKLLPLVCKSRVRAATQMFFCASFLISAGMVPGFLPSFSTGKPRHAGRYSTLRRRRQGGRGKEGQRGIRFVILVLFLPHCLVVVAPCKRCCPQHAQVATIERLALILCVIANHSGSFSRRLQNKAMMRCFFEPPQTGKRCSMKLVHTSIF